MAHFAIARNELGICFNAKLPFHRTGDQMADFITYPLLNRELKRDGVAQGLAEEDFASHGL